MGSIAQIENKIATFESSRQEATHKISELSKLNENFVNISGFKSNIESKESGWDRKANSEDVNKLNTFVNEEVTQIKKNIQNIQNKNDELNENLKNTSQSCNEATLSKNLESSLSQLSNEIKNSKQNQTSDTIIKNIEEKV